MQNRHRRVLMIDYTLYEYTRQSYAIDEEGETTQGFETKHEEAYSPREFSEETKEEEEEEEEEEEGRVEIEEQEQEQEQEEEQEENEKEEGGESEEDLGRVEETEAIGRGVRGVPSATEAERAGGDADSSCEVAETYGGREEEEKDEEDDYGDGDKRVLLSINVELEDDRPSALLILREGDSPSEVAENFCREQNLPDRFIDTLVQHIVENLQHMGKLAKKIKQGEKVWDRLCREKPKKDIQELRNEALTSTLMECTFRPRTNHCSEKFLVESQDCSLETTNRFEQLFWDAEHRRRRQAEYTQWYPEGLLQYSSKITEKRQRLQAEVTRPIDPTTGQELFRPQTGRRPNSQRNSSSLPIGEFLYQLKFVMDNRKQSLAEKEEKKKKELANYHYASGKSEQMLERLKARSLQQIFDGLDLDKDGYVDLNIIDTNQLDNDVANDIGEIKKLEGVLDNPINFNDFVSLMDSIQKKKKKWPRFWLKNGKKHQPGENFVGFKMDQYSRHLASGKTGFGNGRKWYEIVLSERERKLARLEAMRKQKEDQELAECTFKPSIHGKSAKGTPRLTPANQAQARVARQPTVVEEEKHELHGFIFQEASPQEHDSIMSSNRASSVDLVHSLKQMMSVESAGEKHMFSKPAGGTNSNISSLLSELSES